MEPLKRNTGRVCDMKSDRWNILVCVKELPHLVGAMDLFFGENGYHVWFATSLEDIRDAQQGQYMDLLITDLSMIFEAGADCLEGLLNLPPSSLLMILTEPYRSEVLQHDGYELPVYFLIGPGSLKEDLMNFCWHLRWPGGEQAETGFN